jgi:hypothetical protein
MVFRPTDFATVFSFSPIGLPAKKQPEAMEELFR